MSTESGKINIKKQPNDSNESSDDSMDNGDEKSNETRESEEVVDRSRRKFVKRALVEGGVAAVGLVTYGNRDKIVKMANNLLETLPPEAQKEADLLFKEYMSDAETVDLGRVFDIYFLRAQQKIELGKNAEEIKILVDNYKKEVIEIGHDNFKKLTDDKDAVAALVEHSREYAVEIALATSLKKAFLEHISHEEPYEKGSSSVLDPMINSSFQCRSGTDVLTWLMLTNKESFSDVTIIQIQTSGHVLAGFVSKSGDVYGIEVTVEDDGVSSFGNIADLKKDKFPMNIVSAEDYFINAAVKPYKLLKPEEYFLLKNMKDGEGSNGGDSGGSRAVSSFGGFGRSDVTSGRKALKKSRVIHPESYSSKSSSFSEREYRGKLQAYEIKPLSAYEESVINLFSVEEQTNMREYFRESQQLLFLWNMCTEAVNKDNVRSQEVKILEAYLDFFRENPGIERKYDKVIAAINRYNNTKSTEIGRIQFSHNSPRGRYNYAKRILRKNR
jgi:hypothetical protein